MISRILGIVFTTIIAGASAASAQDFRTLMPFKRILAEDVAAGRFRVAEDPAVSERMRAGEPVNAMFQVLTPYRTKEFGSGVSFWVLNADQTRGARVVFRDVEGRDALELHVMRTSSDANGLIDYLPRESLANSKERVGHVTITIGAEQRLLISVEGRTHAMQLDFVPNKLVAQIFCSNSWIAFSDIEPIS